MSNPSKWKCKIKIWWNWVKKQDFTKKYFPKTLQVPFFLFTCLQNLSELERKTLNWQLCTQEKSGSYSRQMWNIFLVNKNLKKRGGNTYLRILFPLSDWLWLKFTWIERERDFMFHYLFVNHETCEWQFSPFFMIMSEKIVKFSMISCEINKITWLVCEQEFTT